MAKAKQQKLLTEADVLALLKEAQGGRSQKDFAALLGIAPSALSEIYGGRHKVNDTVLDHLALEPAGRVFQRKGTTK